MCTDKRSPERRNETPEEELSTEGDRTPSVLPLSRRVYTEDVTSVSSL